jgi:hypothetical protein
MKNLILSTLTILAWHSAPAIATQDFDDIVIATEQILGGRTFQNEDGVIVSFAQLRRNHHDQSAIEVGVNRSGQTSTSHIEVIRKDGDQVVVDEINNGSVTHSFLASVEEPYHVLRIRPLGNNYDGFISRECFRPEGETLHVCYYKLRNQHGVYISVFREVPKS